MTFYERIEMLCANHHITRRQLEKQAGLARGLTTKWRTSNPSRKSLEKMSEFFNVSVDYLLGIEQGVDNDVDNCVLYHTAAAYDVVDVVAVERVARCLVPLPDSYVFNRDCFCVVACDDAMAPILHKSDIVICDIRDSYENGDVLVVEKHGTAYMRLLQDDKLVAMSNEYETLQLSGMKILGRAIECRHKI